LINSLYDWSYGTASAPEPASPTTEAPALDADDYSDDAPALLPSPAASEQAAVPTDTREISLPLNRMAELVLTAAAEVAAEDRAAEAFARSLQDPEKAGLAAATAELRKALSAQRVGLSNSIIVGGTFTPHGQRWTVRLLGGLTVADAIGKIDNLEAAWGIPAGGKVYMSRDLTGGKDQVTILRLDSDPLDKITRTAPIAFGSVSIADPVRIGTFENNEPDTITLLRRHIGIIAANGAGKSTIHWNILNHLTACRDAVYWLIDLQGSAALRMWEPTAGLTAWTIEDARMLLRLGFELAQHRAAGLGVAAREFVLSDDDSAELDVNHIATPEDPALVIVIDEGSLLKDDRECVQLIIDIERTGRKADVTIVYANQRGTDEATGSADIRKEWAERILMRCEEADVDHVLGKEQRLSGWAAHRLELEGTYYHRSTVSSTRQAPMRARSTWPEPGDMRPGIRAALHRRPTFPASATRVLSQAVQPETFRQALDAIGYRLGCEGKTRLTTEDLAARLARRDRAAWGHLNVKQLVPQLREHGIEGPNSISAEDAKDKNISGYYADQLIELEPEGALQ